jgi:hypothetical protein
VEDKTIWISDADKIPGGSLLIVSDSNGKILYSRRGNLPDALFVILEDYMSLPDEKDGHFFPLLQEAASEYDYKIAFHF